MVRTTRTPPLSTLNNPKHFPLTLELVALDNLLRHTPSQMSTSNVTTVVMGAKNPAPLDDVARTPVTVAPMSIDAV